MRTGRRRTRSSLTGRMRTGCRRTENPFSRGRTIYHPEKDNSTNCDRNLEYSTKVNVNVTFNAFNVLFFYGLKNLTDQQLMEVNFGVTINI